MLIDIDKILDEMLDYSTKCCSVCKEIKGKEEFPPDKRARDGLACQCRKCNNKRGREYRKTIRGKEVNRRGVAKYSKTEKGKKTFRKFRLIKHYGIDSDEFEQQLIRQNCICPICSEKLERVFGKTANSLAVDHCHSTELNRGILHVRCNLLLGIYESLTQEAKNHLLKNIDRYISEPRNSKFALARKERLKYKESRNDRQQSN